MASFDYSHILTKSVDELSDSQSYKGLFQQHKEGDPLPSSDSLRRIVELARAILFPGYFGNSTVNKHTIPYHIGVNVESLYNLLTDQIQAGLCFEKENNGLKINEEPCRETATLLAARFIAKLPELRRILATDVEAAYYGDPAATCFGEIISCYPAIRAISNYRIAHELLLLGVPLIPRIITEMAHSETGIDIHPGARIGHHFTIDHGTGVVIGATCIIGNNVKLYQGVTLGAKSFPLDEEGNPIKGIPRHPILEDDVIIYSNATILGRITIGQGATIGGNVWVTEDVPAGARIVQHKR
jgi:serine O-acetyltransferase